MAQSDPGNAALMVIALFVIAALWIGPAILLFLLLMSVAAKSAVRARQR